MTRLGIQKLVGKRVRAARLADGMTQERLAQATRAAGCFCAARYIGQIENGHVLPGSMLLSALATALDTTTDALLGRSD